MSHKRNQPISDLTIQRLVDGELTATEYRHVLRELSQTENGWRRCALAFLEEQALRHEMRAMDSDALDPDALDPTAGDPTAGDPTAGFSQSDVPAGARQQRSDTPPGPLGLTDDPAETIGAVRPADETSELIWQSQVVNTSVAGADENAVTLNKAGTLDASTLDASTLENAGSPGNGDAVGADKMNGAGRRSRGASQLAGNGVKRRWLRLNGSYATRMIGAWSTRWPGKIAVAMTVAVICGLLAHRYAPLINHSSVAPTGSDASAVHSPGSGSPQFISTKVPVRESSSNTPYFQVQWEDIDREWLKSVMGEESEPQMVDQHAEVRRKSDGMREYDLPVQQFEYSPTDPDRYH